MNKSKCSSRQDAKTPSFFFKKIFAAWRLCASFCFLTLTVSAEELVRFPTVTTAWDVQVLPSKFINSGTAANKDMPNPARTGTQLTAISVMQDESKRCYRATYSNDKVRETWEFPQYGVCLVETPRGNVTRASVPTDMIPFGTGAFTWLRPEFRKGAKPENYLNKSCWHYEGTRNLYNDDGEVYSVLKCAAWVEAETLLPVALDDGVNYGVFKFREETTLKLPEKFKQELAPYLFLNGLPAMKE